MVFTNRSCDDTYSVCMNGLNLSRVFVTKFLGVHTDSKLDWIYHIDIVRNKVAKNVSVMNRVKHVLTSSALYSLYCTLVMPYHTYCCEVWGNNYKTRIQSLFILQKELLEFVWILITNATQNLCFINLDHLMFLTLLTLTAWCLCTRHFTIYYLQICCHTSKKLMTVIIITQEIIISVSK